MDLIEVLDQKGVIYKKTNKTRHNYIFEQTRQWIESNFDFNKLFTEHNRDFETDWSRIKDTFTSNP